MLPFLQKVFREVVSMPRSAYDKSLIDEYSPDTIIVSEAVERNTVKGGGFRLI